MSAAAVFAVSLAWFAAGVEKCGIASIYCDPVNRIAAQDESVYGREAIDMAAHGNWLTPMYLGRYVLNKPPLLQILSACSVKMFGVSAWALRLPSLVAAALTAALVFSLVWRLGSLVAAAGAVLLLASNHLFYIFSRLSMTDMLLTFWLALAMYVLADDPALRRGRSLWIFAACSGAAILTKAAAGALPLIALLIHTCLAPRDVRPRFSRLAAVCGAAAAIALPWHLYQLFIHTRWFVAEYILTAHFLVGLAAPPQYSNESHLVFYARRLFLMDPVLTASAAAAVLALARTWRSRSVSLAWIGAALFALFAFRYRSGYYLLPLIPALAAIAGQSLTLIPARVQSLALVLLAACAVVKLGSASPVWNIPANETSERLVAPALDRYCELHRGNGLVLIDPKDEFYASILPIARIRYALLGAEPPAPPIDYAWLGIWMPAAQFVRLKDWLPVYRNRLRSFGLDSDMAVGSVIWAQSPAEIAGIVNSHPESDFALPARLARGFEPAGGHRVVSAGDGLVFLLSPTPTTFSEARPCHL